MKKLFTLLVCLYAITSQVKAQYVNIPDTNFRNWLITKYPTCFNSAKQMDTTCSAVVNEDSLDLYQLSYPSFQFSISGIEYFKKLKYLVYFAGSSYIIMPTKYPDSLSEINLALSRIDSFSLLPKNLKKLDLRNCSIANSQLPVLPNSLEYLDVSGSLLFNLPNLLSTNLKWFNCSSSNTSNLPALPNSIEYLDCSDNPQITSIPNFPNNLIYLKASSCKISSSIPYLPFLKEIYFYNNQITQFPRFSDSVRIVDFSYNSIVGNVSKFPDSLRSLYLRISPSSSLPNFPDSLKFLVLELLDSATSSFIPKLPDSLKMLGLGFSVISTLPKLPDSLQEFSVRGVNHIPSFPKSLKKIDCSGNQLDSLPELPNHLQYFNCSNNKISKLPNIVTNSLNTLDISWNKMSKLENSKIIIQGDFYAQGNLFSSLPSIECWGQEVRIDNNPNLYCMPVINGSARVYIDSSKIRCSPNLYGAFHIDIGFFPGIGTAVPIVNFPLCDPITNVNQCVSLPSIYGRVFYDINSNGIKDANEKYGIHNKLQLSTGKYSFTQSTGYYQFIMDSIGTFKIFATVPTFFKAVPDTLRFNFNMYDTFVQVPDIALQPLVIKDSFLVTCTPISWAARPNREYVLNLQAQNVGTTNLNPTLTLSFDSSLLSYDSSLNPAFLNTGNQLSINLNNFTPGQIVNMQVFFKVKINATMGAALQTVANITANNLSQSDTSTTFIRSSYDPNDKHATLALTPTQVSQGKYIDYVVNFQNTGNDTAFNVVIADTLDKKLDVTSLQVITASHKVKTTVKDGVTYFEFLNIMLVDSNTNEPGSHGFVRFKIRPKKTVQLGDTLFNQANIYFDYNTAINTNITKTVIKTISIVTPINLLSYELKRTSQHSILNSWQTTVEENVQQFNIQRSYTGKNFETVGVIKAQNKPSSYSYLDEVNATYTTIYYRLQIINKDGSIQYSDVKAINVQDKSLVQVYPNPSSQYVLVKGEGLKQIVVKDLTGKILQTIQLADANQFKLDVQTYNKGLYVLEVVTKNEKVITKLVKQ